MIPVTKPFLPPAEEYEAYIKQIWERQWLTNNGPLVNELELQLRKYLSVDNLLYLTNGTVALQIAIKALGLRGEIITTPFSFVATTSSIVWEGCTPVFVDIDPSTFNIDPTKIEAAITPQTTAILATHVFGNPCNIDIIQGIADQHNLKVIYDAAHCFGTKYKGKSVFEYGDVSTTSFHATKLFHTIEGGAVFSQSAEVLKKMTYMRNFGYESAESFADVGINGKNSEFHAAMGLCNIKYIHEILRKRKQLSDYYTQGIAGLPLASLWIQDGSEFNYAYYPIVFETEQKLEKTLSLLNKNWIYPRRYFYPSLHELPYINGKSMPISSSISNRILCLPLYYQLTEIEIDMVINIVRKALIN